MGNIPMVIWGRREYIDQPSLASFGQLLSVDFARAVVEIAVPRARPKVVLRAGTKVVLASLRALILKVQFASWNSKSSTCENPKFVEGSLSC